MAKNNKPYILQSSIDTRSHVQMRHRSGTGSSLQA